ncbi:unnamed protein product [Spodoptera exigua]|nr:unnamed protein product [Spodoptera exigua]
MTSAPSTSQPPSAATSRVCRSGWRIVVRALTWRRLRRVQRRGARLQRQTEARAGQSQLAQQDPHAAKHIPLTARALTHSVSRLRSAGRERARGGTRWRTGGALLRPPPPRLVAISRRLTSRRRRHGCDVINGTSHGPPAAASPRPPARACANGIASTGRSFHTAAPPAPGRYFVPASLCLSFPRLNSRLHLC